MREMISKKSIVILLTALAVVNIFLAVNVFFNKSVLVEVAIYNLTRSIIIPIFGVFLIAFPNKVDFLSKITEYRLGNESKENTYISYLIGLLAIFIPFIINIVVFYWRAKE